MRKERVFVPALTNQWLLSKAKGKLIKINGRTFPVASKTATKAQNIVSCMLEFLCSTGPHYPAEVIS